MRLWHQKLITKLPQRQLSGQHRECCALRGKGWGKKHSTVDYVFTYQIEKLIEYHFIVIREMEKRGNHPNSIWKNPSYRGKALGYNNTIDKNIRVDNDDKMVYSEHNDEYLRECIINLKDKKINV